MIIEAYQSIAIALGLGLLVGLQRQWSDSEIAGIRTFPLITLAGTVTALIGRYFQFNENQDSANLGLLVGSGVIATAITLAIANFAKIKSGKFDFGMTTESAAILMFLVGAALGVGLTGPAVVIAGAIAVLLHWKDRLHRMVNRMADKDIRGVIQFALIGLVILPVLPDQTYGWYNVLNPYSIWRMVVLIVGISMVAYVAFKFVGSGAGALLGGVLGGLISSTATTVSYARQTADSSDSNMVAAFVIMVASTIVNIRVLFEVGVVAPELFRAAAPPMILMLILMTFECLLLLIPLRKQTTQTPDHDNPAQLKPAIIFGALYAVILFLVAAAKDVFGDGALYGIATISGLTDVDAITLSTAKLFNDGRVDAATAWRVILIATMSNLVFKAGAVAFLGSRRLMLWILLLFGIAIAGGALLLWSWESISTEIYLWFPQLNELLPDSSSTPSP